MKNGQPPHQSTREEQHSELLQQLTAWVQQTNRLWRQLQIYLTPKYFTKFKQALEKSFETGTFLLYILDPNNPIVISLGEFLKLPTPPHFENTKKLFYTELSYQNPNPENIKQCLTILFDAITDECQKFHPLDKNINTLLSHAVVMYILKQILHSNLLFATLNMYITAFPEEKEAIGIQECASYSLDLLDYCLSSEKLIKNFGKLSHSKGPEKKKIAQEVENICMQFKTGKGELYLHSGQYALAEAYYTFLLNQLNFYNSESKEQQIINELFFRSRLAHIFLQQKKINQAIQIFDLSKIHLLLEGLQNSHELAHQYTMVIDIYDRIVKYYQNEDILKMAEHAHNLLNFMQWINPKTAGLLSAKIAQKETEITKMVSSHNEQIIPALYTHLICHKEFFSCNSQFARGGILTLCPTQQKYEEFLRSSLSQNKLNPLNGKEGTIQLLFNVHICPYFLLKVIHSAAKQCRDWQQKEQYKLQQHCIEEHYGLLQQIDAVLPDTSDQPSSIQVTKHLTDQIALSPLKTKIKTRGVRTKKGAYTKHTASTTTENIVQFKTEFGDFRHDPQNPKNSSAWPFLSCNPCSYFGGIDPNLKMSHQLKKQFRKILHNGIMAYKYGPGIKWAKKETRGTHWFKLKPPTQERLYGHLIETDNDEHLFILFDRLEKKH